MNLVLPPTQEEALRTARGQFAFYAEQHRAKGTEDGASKAATNDRMVALCDAALDRPQWARPFLDQALFMSACDQSISESNMGQAGLYLRLIGEEITELREAIDAGDVVEQADAVMDLIVVLIGFALSRGWPANALWTEVMRSNMAKIDPVTGKVLKRPDGKVLKPEGWTPPDIAGVLRDHGVEI